jgi:hypothetical protein
MNATQVTVEGTLKPDGSLEVAEKLSLPPGRVRVTVEVLPEPSANRSGLVEFLDRIRREPVSTESAGRSKEEIDASISALRDEWEGRMGEIERLQEECRQARRNPAC